MTSLYSSLKRDDKKVESSNLHGASEINIIGGGLTTSPSLVGTAALAEAELYDEDIDNNALGGINLNDVEFVDNETSCESPLLDIDNNDASSTESLKPTGSINNQSSNSVNLLKQTTSSLLNGPLSPSSIHRANLPNNQPPSPFKTTSTDKCNEQITKKINNLKMSLLNNSNANTNNSSKFNFNNETGGNSILSPEERVSHEAKEYWATIDLYNNSKLAFNKRCKSVKQKRDKLNAELFKRQEQHHQQQQKSLTVDVCNDNNNTVILDDNQQLPMSPSNIKVNTIEPHELCTCVKCSIVYHEALIKGITDIHAIVCKKCKNKLVHCKCCSSYQTSPLLGNCNSNGFTLSPSLSTSSSNTSSNRFSVSSISTENIGRTTSKDEFVQFEDKLFNIKNELVRIKYFMIPF